MNIPDLHALYERLTGFKLRLDFHRERVWFEWAKVFSDEDLRIMVAHLQRCIREGTRNPGALKFHNLIGNVDLFEEDLQYIRARSRPRPPSHERVKIGTTERIMPALGTRDVSKSIKEVVESNGFKELMRFKEQLR